MKKIKDKRQHSIEESDISHNKTKFYNNDSEELNSLNLKNFYENNLENNSFIGIAEINPSLNPENKNHKNKKISNYDYINLPSKKEIYENIDYFNINPIKKEKLQKWDNSKKLKFSITSRTNPAAYSRSKSNSSNSKSKQKTNKEKIEEFLILDPNFIPGKRLYEQYQKKLPVKQERHNQIKESKYKDEIKDATFTPVLNKNSRRIIDKSFDREKSVSPSRVEDRLIKYGTNALQKFMRENTKNTIKESNHSFHPILNEKTQIIATIKRKERIELAKKYLEANKTEINIDYSDSENITNENEEYYPNKKINKNYNNINKDNSESKDSLVNSEEDIKNFSAEKYNEKNFNTKNNYSHTDRMNKSNVESENTFFNMRIKSKDKNKITAENKNNKNNLIGKSPYKNTINKSPIGNNFQNKIIPNKNNSKNYIPLNNKNKKNSNDSFNTFQSKSEVSLKSNSLSRDKKIKFKNSNYSNDSVGVGEDLSKPKTPLKIKLSINF